MNSEESDEEEDSGRKAGRCRTRDLTVHEGSLLSPTTISYSPATYTV